MRKPFFVLAVLMVLLLPVSGGWAAVSDYEIIQTYKTTHAALLAEIKAAASLDQCDALERRVAALKAEAEPHRALLNDGLHPETYDASIAALESQLKLARERNLLAAELKDTSEKLVVTSKDLADTRQQNEALQQELAALNEKVQKLEAENASMTAEIKTLQADAKKDKATIARLQQLNEKLRANIKNRDALILEMMDGLFGQFSKPNLTDEQKKSLRVNVDSSDYVHRIIATIDDNEKFLETASLTAQDALFMVEEQKKFAAHWEKISPHLSKLYPDQQTQIRSFTMVDSRLAAWKKNMDDTIWKRIAQVFSQQGIHLDPFASANEFTERVLAHIDAELKKPNEERYKAFHAVWTTQIKEQWMPVLQAYGLTDQKRGEIEERLARWARESASKMGLWLLVGGLVIVVIAVLVIRANKGKAGKPV